MKELQKTLDKIDGYLLNISRNVDKGQYELEVGIPKNWAYKSTDVITCDTLQETDQGDLVKITPNDDSVVIDDLIEFVNIIIDTNKRIVQMQKEFDEQLEKAKEDLVSQVKSFQTQIDALKDNSFEEMETKQKEVGKKSKDIKEKVEEKISS